MGNQTEIKKVRNLLVVDWRETTPARIQELLNTANLPQYEWSVFNCNEKKYAGSGVVNRYTSYLMAVRYILKHKNKYDNIIIWQQMIGFMLCLLPKFYSKPNIIVSMLLYSPGRVKAGSFRLYLLIQALKKADALLYFSGDMAEDVKKVYPGYANKVFSTYVPIINDMVKTSRGVNLTSGNENNNAVFSGGLSDRDFETVVKAFTGTKVPVRIVCTNSYVFKNPELLTDNFTISRNVSKTEYNSLILSSSFIVIALEYEQSSCGQLLFTFGMRNRIPIIASDCFGTRDYITNNDNGILVPIKDDRAIYNAYQMLVNDEVFRNKLVERSFEISQKMTFENYLIKIDSIIKEIN